MRGHGGGGVVCMRVCDDFVSGHAWLYCYVCVCSNNISMNILYTGEAVWCIHFSLGFHQQQGPVSRMPGMFSCCSGGVRGRSLLGRDADTVVIRR